jgi:tetratricopeptide (TPR) repeat protein
VFISRMSLAVVIVASLVLHAWPIDSPQAAPPSKEQIARWIRQLGSQDFGAREEASRKLWEAGQAAEDAVAAASKDEDMEVRRRASVLHDRFKWGIYPDTPKTLADLINRYQGAGNDQRYELVRSFLYQGVPGCRALKRIVQAEPDPAVRQQLATNLLYKELPQAMPVLLEEQQYAVVENILDITLDVDIETTIAHYVAYWLLRGRIDERIAYHTSLEGKENRRQAEILTYLHRGKGDEPAALAAARRSGNDRLIDGMLFEMAAWKELAFRGNAVHESLGGDTRAEQFAHRATFHHLAGNTAAAQDTFEEMRRYQKTLPRNDHNEQDVIASAFVVNDLPDDAVEALKTRGAWSLAYEILVARFRFAEAEALVAKARDAGYPDLVYLELKQARTWSLLGDKEKALPVFARHASRLQKEMTSHRLDDLIEEEMRAGLTDLAFEHAGVVLDAQQGISRGYNDILRLLFPRRYRTAIALRYTVFWGNKGVYPSTVLNRLRPLLTGQAPKKEAIALLDAEIPALLQGGPDKDFDTAVWETLAEVASLADLDARSQTCLEKADSVASLIKLGDRQAGNRQWETAARYYQKAFNKDLQSRDFNGRPLALYLYGHSLVQAGRDKEGREAMLRAYWLPLGNEVIRHDFAVELLKRGEVRDSQRENGMILRSGAIAGWTRAEANRRNALAALSRKEYLACAAALQQESMWALTKDDGFMPSSSRPPAAWLASSASIHRYSALGLIKTGKVTEAIKETELAQTILPSDLDPVIDLIPELEALGRGDEATALYRRGRAVFEQLLKDHPRSAEGHNGVAWVGACCHRDLDVALVHARKAVELAPEIAAYHDTLAEVFFQMGQKDRAIETLRKAESLFANGLHFQKQLERLQAGDPKAIRPLRGKEIED